MMNIEVLRNLARETLIEKASRLRLSISDMLALYGDLQLESQALMREGKRLNQQVAKLAEESRRQHRNDGIVGESLKHFGYGEVVDVIRGSIVDTAPQAWASNIVASISASVSEAASQFVARQDSYSRPKRITPLKRGTRIGKARGLPEPPRNCISSENAETAPCRTLRRLSENCVNLATSQPDLESDLSMNNGFEWQCSTRQRASSMHEIQKRASIRSSVEENSFESSIGSIGSHAYQEKTQSSRSTTISDTPVDVVELSRSSLGETESNQIEKYNAVGEAIPITDDSKKQRTIDPFNKDLLRQGEELLLGSRSLESRSERVRVMVSEWISADVSKDGNNEATTSQLDPLCSVSANFPFNESSFVHPEVVFDPLHPVESNIGDRLMDEEEGQIAMQIEAALGLRDVNSASLRSRPINRRPCGALAHQSFEFVVPSDLNDEQKKYPKRWQKKNKIRENAENQLYEKQNASVCRRASKMEEHKEVALELSESSPSNKRIENIGSPNGTALQDGQENYSCPSETEIGQNRLYENCFEEDDVYDEKVGRKKQICRSDGSISNDISEHNEKDFSNSIDVALKNLSINVRKHDMHFTLDNDETVDTLVVTESTTEDILCIDGYDNRNRNDLERTSIVKVLKSPKTSHGLPLTVPESQPCKNVMGADSACRDFCSTDTSEFIDDLQSLSKATEQLISLQPKSPLIQDALVESSQDVESSSPLDIDLLSSNITPHQLQALPDDSSFLGNAPLNDNATHRSLPTNMTSLNMVTVSYQEKSRYKTIPIRAPSQDTLPNSVIVSNVIQSNSSPSSISHSSFSTIACENHLASSPPNLTPPVSYSYPQVKSVIISPDLPPASPYAFPSSEIILSKQLDCNSTPKAIVDDQNSSNVINSRALNRHEKDTTNTQFIVQQPEKLLYAKDSTIEEHQVSSSLEGGLNMTAAKELSSYKTIDLNIDKASTTICSPSSSSSKVRSTKLRIGRLIHISICPLHSSEAQVTWTLNTRRLLLEFIDLGRRQADFEVKTKESSHKMKSRKIAYKTKGLSVSFGQLPMYVSVVQSSTKDMNCQPLCWTSQPLLCSPLHPSNSFTQTIPLHHIITLPTTLDIIVYGTPSQVTLVSDRVRASEPEESWLRLGIDAATGPRSDLHSTNITSLEPFSVPLFRSGIQVQLKEDDKGNTVFTKLKDFTPTRSSWQSSVNTAEREQQSHSIMMQDEQERQKNRLIESTSRVTSISRPFVPPVVSSNYPQDQKLATHLTSTAQAQTETSSTCNLSLPGLPFTPALPLPNANCTEFHPGKRSEKKILVQIKQGMVDNAIVEKKSSESKENERHLTRQVSLEQSITNDKQPLKRVESLSLGYMSSVSSEVAALLDGFRRVDSLGITGAWPEERKIITEIKKHTIGANVVPLSQVSSKPRLGEHGTGSSQFLNTASNSTKIEGSACEEDQFGTETSSRNLLKGPKNYLKPSTSNAAPSSPLNISQEDGQLLERVDDLDASQVFSMESPLEKEPMLVNNSIKHVQDRKTQRQSPKHKSISHLLSNSSSASPESKNAKTRNNYLQVNLRKTKCQQQSRSDASPKPCSHLTSKALSSSSVDMTTRMIKANDLQGRLLSKIVISQEEQKHTTEKDGCLRVPRLGSHRIIDHVDLLYNKKESVNNQTREVRCESNCNTSRDIFVIQVRVDEDRYEELRYASDSNIKERCHKFLQRHNIKLLFLSGLEATANDFIQEVMKHPSRHKIHHHRLQLLVYQKSVDIADLLDI